MDVSKLLLQEENGRLLRALEFYGDEEMYALVTRDGRQRSESTIQWDSGKYAREALQERTSDDINQDLYCVAQHLQSLVEYSKYDQVADRARACNTCKYVNECDSIFFVRARTLTALTGIRFSALVKRNREN